MTRFRNAQSRFDCFKVAHLTDKNDIRVFSHPLSLRAMRERFDAGGIPVVLVSSYRFDRSKQPHWVVVTGFDERYVYLHDPYIDSDSGKTPMDCMQIPIAQSEFARMARYGRSQQKAALVLSKRGTAH